MAMCCTNEWQSLRGRLVNVHLHGESYRQGVVDDAMPDASGIWLAANGFHPRELVEKVRGYDIWTSLYTRTDGMP
ncbi:MAG: hypothetical protein JWQ68_1042 [Cryobacterium sp.]|jgi:UDP-N-acetyl-D-mannosaminuronic acid transferase (WecB/TagA/CpsF family)|nr:hypothetical protein [Cryobacterium sp.]